MRIVNRVRARDELLIPAIAAGLVAADEQERDPAGIECVKDPVGAAFVLDSQLPHMRMA